MDDGGCDRPAVDPADPARGYSRRVGMPDGRWVLLSVNGEGDVMTAPVPRSVHYGGRGRLWWLPAGGLGNGLDDDAWVPILEVRERAVPEILAALRRAGVPAYAAPAGLVADRLRDRSTRSRSARGRSIGGRSVHGRSARDGSARDGMARDGSARDGMARDGSARDGMARDGSAWDGMARDGSAWDGLARDRSGPSPDYQLWVGASAYGEAESALLAVMPSLAAGAAGPDDPPDAAAWR